MLLNQLNLAVQELLKINKDRLKLKILCTLYQSTYSMPQAETNSPQAGACCSPSWGSLCSLSFSMNEDEISPGQVRQRLSFYIENLLN